MAEYEIPNDLRYTKDHEWIKVEGDEAVVGITDFAQNQLGDIIYVELPAVGKELAAHQSLGVVESVKSVSDVYAPVAGVVAKVNEALATTADLLNKIQPDELRLHTLMLEPGAPLYEQMEKGEFVPCGPKEIFKEAVRHNPELAKHAADMWAKISFVDSLVPIHMPPNGEPRTIEILSAAAEGASLDVELWALLGNEFTKRQMFENAQYANMTARTLAGKEVTVKYQTEVDPERIRKKRAQDAEEADRAVLTSPEFWETIGKELEKKDAKEEAKIFFQRAAEFRKFK